MKATPLETFIHFLSLPKYHIEYTGIIIMKDKGGRYRQVLLYQLIGLRRKQIYGNYVRHLQEIL
jgi:hypothetical protein